MKAAPPNRAPSVPTPARAATAPSPGRRPSRRPKAKCERKPKPKAKPKPAPKAEVEAGAPRRRNSRWRSCRFTRDKRGVENFLSRPADDQPARQSPAARALLVPLAAGRQGRTGAVRRSTCAGRSKRRIPKSTFDWRAIVETPIPSADADKWRERRRAERAAKHAATEDELARSEAAESFGRRAGISRRRDRRGGRVSARRGEVRRHRGPFGGRLALCLRRDADRDQRSAAGDAAAEAVGTRAGSGAASAAASGTEPSGD